MRVLCVVMVLAVAGLTLLGGCDSDGGGGGSGTVLAQGTITIPAGGAVDVATVQVSEPGTLQAQITWSGAPTELMAAFRHVATSDTHGMTMSPSPLISTAAVSSADVAAGTDWLFRAADVAGTAVTVEYEIRFLPD